MLCCAVLCLCADDTKTGEGMLTFLLKWFERFPEFKDNKLFLAGQSYAGGQTAAELHV